jgi:hypothetical protein
MTAIPGKVLASRKVSTPIEDGRPGTWPQATPRNQSQTSNGIGRTTPPPVDGKPMANSQMFCADRTFAGK